MTTLVTGILGIAAVTDTVPVTSIVLFSTPEPSRIGFASSRVPVVRALPHYACCTRSPTPWACHEIYQMALDARFGLAECAGRPVHYRGEWAGDEAGAARRRAAGTWWGGSHDAHTYGASGKSCGVFRHLGTYNNLHRPATGVDTRSDRRRATSLGSGFPCSVSSTRWAQMQCSH